MAFSIQRFEVRDRGIISQLASNDYPEVFADEPWNEWVKCLPESSEEVEVYFGRSTNLNPGDACPSCQSPLARYYEFQPTYEKILKEVSQPGAIALLGILNQIVVGFAWSYCSDISTIATTKWDNIPMQSTVMNSLKPYVGERGEIRYLSEVGVQKSYRNQGIATALSKDATRDNVPIVVRTNQDSPMATICENLGLLRVIGPDLQVQDSVRPDRVLYVSPRKY